MKWPHGSHGHFGSGTLAWSRLNSKDGFFKNSFPLIIRTRRLNEFSNNWKFSELASLVGKGLVDLGRVFCPPCMTHSSQRHTHNTNDRVWGIIYDCPISPSPSRTRLKKSCPEQSSAIPTGRWAASERAGVVDFYNYKSSNRLQEFQQNYKSPWAQHCTQSPNKKTH